MIDMGTMSYLGVPLINSAKRIIGHLVVFDDQSMPADPLALSVMETFAARASAELERNQADEEARRPRVRLGPARIPLVAVPAKAGTPCQPLPFTATIRHPRIVAPTQDMARPGSH